jgi:hypothetical protein
MSGGHVRGGHEQGGGSTEDDAAASGGERGGQEGRGQQEPRRLERTVAVGTVNSDLSSKTILMAVAIPYLGIGPEGRMAVIVVGGVNYICFNKCDRDVNKCDRDAIKFNFRIY